MVKPRSENKVEEQAKTASNIGPKTESCKYKGVRKRKWGKWVSEIRLPNSRERIWLGSYDSPIKAARAFDAALFCLRGHAAKFNFPDNPPEIPGGRSLSPSQIQLAAARFANSFSHGEEHTSSMDGISATSESTLFGEFGSDVNANTRPSSDEPFFDLVVNSANFGADYGIFPGFDELNYNGFIAPTPPEQVLGGSDYYEENCDGVLAQDLFLWNF